MTTCRSAQKAQLLSYMKLLNVPLGLLFNFHFVLSPEARVITCILAQFIAIAFIAATAGTPNQSSN
jgi:PD-(D/E)XK nuclease superfamily